MKKKSYTLLISAALASSLLFSSCIGSFGLSNKLLDWNKNLDSKFVNELVFIAFCIIPVYEVAGLADILVLNSIEFWSGSNPVADTGNIKKIETKDGVYAIKTQKDGYKIQKEGEDKAIELVFNETEQSWNIEAENTTTKLFKFTNNNEVVMFLPNGSEMNVELNQSGVLAFKQIAEGYSYYAAK